MAEPIGALRVDLSANAAQFQKDMNRARGAVRTSTNRMNRDFGGFRKQIGATTAGLGTLRTAIAGLGVGLVLREIVRTSAVFQKLQASLKTVTGSAGAASSAFALIKEFASTTPFSLEEVTRGFIKLKALGLDPSAKALQSYGNTASAMAKSLNDFVEAVADAVTGEFERLKEFGIKAASEGKNVSFTFQGMTTTVKKNAAEIEKYLRGIGDVQFAGAMAEQARTLGGALSNLGDSASVFANEIGEGGLAAAVADVARELSDLTNGSQSVAREIGGALGNAIRTLAELAIIAAKNIRTISAAIAGFIAYKVATVFAGAAVAVLRFATTIRTAATATLFLTNALKLNPIGLFTTVIAGGVAALIGFSEAKADATAAAASHTTQLATETGAIEDQTKALKEAQAASLEQLVTLTEARADALRTLDSLPPIGESISIGDVEITGISVARFDDLAAAIKAEEAAATSARARLAELKNEIASLSTTVTKVTPEFNEMRAAIKKNATELQFEIDQLGRTKTEQELYSLAKKAGVEVNDSFRRTLTPLIRELALEEQVHKAIAEAADDELKAKEKLAARGVAIVKETRTSVEEYSDSIEELNKLHQSGAIDAETWRRGIKKAQDTLDDSKVAIKNNNDLVKDLGLTFTSAFENAVVAGGKLSDVLRGLEQDLLKLALRKTVTEPLFAGLESAFGGGGIGDLFSGLFDGSAGISPTGADIVGTPFATGGAFTVGGKQGVDKNFVPLQLTRGERVTVQTPGQQGEFDSQSGVTLVSNDVSVIVNAPPGSKAETQESNGPGGRTIEVFIDEAVSRNINTPGSRTNRAMRQNFGVQPQLKGRG